MNSASEEKSLAPTTVYDGIDFQSVRVTLIVIVLGLLVQTPTTAYFFHKIQSIIKPDFHNGLNWFISICYCLVAEGATFIWTIKGHKTYAWSYCLIAVFINLSQILDFWDQLSMFMFLGGCLMCIIAPVSIALFSEDFYEKLQQQTIIFKQDKNGKYFRAS